MSEAALFNVECVLLVFATMCAIGPISVVGLASHTIYPDIANNIEEAVANAYYSARLCTYTTTLTMDPLHTCSRFQVNFVEA